MALENAAVVDSATHEALPEGALWGGRFREALAEIALSVSASVDVDGKLYRQDIEGSLAHVRMLAAQNIIGEEDARAIANGLREIRAEVEEGTFRFLPEHEDVHLAIERRLIEKIGPVGGRLHTARSRNDQVAVDERLFVREALDELAGRVDALQRVLVAAAEKNTGVLMPGYTHLQRAQPVLLGHHLLAYVSMLNRDRERLLDCRRRMNRSPLGAAALAGTSFPIDREMTARELGFDGIVENSIDAVADRDYLIEAASACSITMMHLSRLAEEIVLWASHEFGFIRISDAYATGSSIMPQKKNPDMAELVRGKTGRVYGALINLLTMMKGLPLAYNRDMQEDKEPMFDMLETASQSLAVMTGMLEEAEFIPERTSRGLRDDFTTATELADYLVRKGLPFRRAHEVVGKLVAHCLEHGHGLAALELETMQRFSPVFADDVFDCLIPERSVQMKQSAGSTSPTEVGEQIVRWKERFAMRDRGA